MIMRVTNACTNFTNVVIRIMREDEDEGKGVVIVNNNNPIVLLTITIA
jgi:hypothetical protein